MTRITTLFAAATLMAALAAPVLAQTPSTTSPPPAAEPSTTDKVVKRTKAEWKKLRAEWRKDKEKYKTCSAKTKAEGLKGTVRDVRLHDAVTVFPRPGTRQPPRSLRRLVSFCAAR